MKTESAARFFGVLREWRWDRDRPASSLLQAEDGTGETVMEHKPESEATFPFWHEEDFHPAVYFPYPSTN